MEDESLMPFEHSDSKVTENIIKVIGVGGGGGNAVNHMFRQGIQDVKFAICNTDRQALDGSPVPTKIQLGYEGLGAGNKPERAKAAAEETLEDLKIMLSDGCRMAFITAGMGGGTGTGAGPIVAKVAKEMDILTVGIVTIPFLFEGKNKINQALDGVEEMSKHVDALLVINNERLRDVYSDISLMSGFARADDTLTIAARSIAEIITLKGKINLDFNDVRTVLKDGGVALMSTGYGEGEGRVNKAIQDALNSPLLNNNDIFNSKKILFVISYSTKNELMMSEMDEVHEFMSKFGGDFETKWGLYIDDSLEDKIKFTILATGFGIRNIPGIEEKYTAEQLDQMQAKEEKNQQNIERMNRYYGPVRSSKKKHYNSYTFTQEDLDDDDIISMVETIPTYQRTRSQLESIRNKTSEKKTIVTPPTIDEGGTITISFE